MAINFKGFVSSIKKGVNKLGNAGDTMTNYGSAMVGNAKARKNIRKRINNERFLSPKVKADEFRIKEARAEYKAEKKKRGLDRIF